MNAYVTICAPWKYFSVIFLMFHSLLTDNNCSSNLHLKVNETDFHKYLEIGSKLKHAYSYIFLDIMFKANCFKWSIQFFANEMCVPWLFNPKHDYRRF